MSVIKFLSPYHRSTPNDDEAAELKEAGIDAAYVIYDEAGVGFADHVCRHMDHRHLQDAGLTS